MVPLNDVRGAVSGAAIARPSRARLTVSERVRTVGATILASCHGLAIVDTTPRPTSSRSDGTRCDAAAPGASAESSGGASGSRLHRNEIMFDPETPSTEE